MSLELVVMGGDHMYEYLEAHDRQSTIFFLSIVGYLFLKNRRKMVPLGGSVAVKGDLGGESSRFGSSL